MWPYFLNPIIVVEHPQSDLFLWTVAGHGASMTWTMEGTEAQNTSDTILGMTTLKFLCFRDDVDTFLNYSQEEFVFRQHAASIYGFVRQLVS